MRHSTALVSLAALVAAVPMSMQNTKRAVDTEYETYGKYGKYASYGDYPGDGAAKMQRGKLFYHWSKAAADTLQQTPK
jgi:hypothetical protein